MPYSFACENNHFHQSSTHLEHKNKPKDALASLVVSKNLKQDLYKFGQNHLKIPKVTQKLTSILADQIDSKIDFKLKLSELSSQSIYSR